MESTVEKIRQLLALNDPASRLEAAKLYAGIITCRELPREVREEFTRVKGFTMGTMEIVNSGWKPGRNIL